jgi:hypothetical protein
MACCPRRRELFFADFFPLLVLLAETLFDFDLGGVVA